MINITFRTQALLITMPILALIASSNANAEIYKWRDSRGVTQYSDRPPVNNASKLTPNEVVNSLQTKDLCTVGPIKKSVSTNTAATENQSEFFNIFSRARANANVAAITARLVAAQQVFKLPIQVTAAPKPTTPATVTTPPQAAVSVPVQTPTLPAVINQPVNTATTPVATTPPTQVAANTPSPATTPTVETPASNLPNIVQELLMPAVDISKNMIPVIGYSVFRTQTTSEIAPPSDIGTFRMPCKISHMSNDDPLVYPNQQGAAHHHTFFGNTNIDYKSNLNNLATTGNSTCNGGIMNRSAYWVPTMINTETNAPIVPSGDILVYYKSGYSIDGKLIKAPPKGLRMIAGNSKATTQAESSNSGFTCHPGPNSKRTSWPRTPQIRPSSECKTGDDLMFSVSFPQCWDGKNLDSPNHKDHMAYPEGNNCPTTHPVPIPEISFNVHFSVTDADKIDKWRLASDNYSASLPGGYSGHGDWVNGWDEASMNGIIKNCLNAKRDGHAHLLCDGRQFY